MTAYTAETLDLSRLGAPSLVDTTYATIRKARLDHLAAAWAAEQAKDPSLPDLDPLDIESSVAVILTEEYSTGDMLLKQAVNDAANSLRLATASGADLRSLAVTYAKTAALIIRKADPTANPPQAEVIEGDDDLRARAQLAPEAFPMFGLTPGGYIWRVKSLFGDRLKGVRAIRRGGGRIDLVVLARDGDGTPPPGLVGDIQAAFEGEDASQSSDIVTVVPATIVRYAISVTLGIRSGPDANVVTAAAAKRLQSLADRRHAIAETVSLQQIEAAALGSPAIAETMALATPAIDVLGGEAGAPYCTGITVLPAVAP